MTRRWGGIRDRRWGRLDRPGPARRHSDRSPQAERSSPVRVWKRVNQRIAVRKELQEMSRTIVFIHGAWLTPASWSPFKDEFESRGYTCIAPAWPYMDRPV